MIPSKESLRVAIRMGVPSGVEGMASPRLRRREGPFEARREPIRPPPIMVQNPSSGVGVVGVPSVEIPREEAHLERVMIFLALRDAIWRGCVRVVGVDVVVVQALVVSRELVRSRSVATAVNVFILTLFSLLSRLITWNYVFKFCMNVTCVASMTDPES